MKTEAGWKETIARHRALGRGRKFFWVLVLGTALIAAAWTPERRAELVERWGQR